MQNYPYYKFATYFKVFLTCLILSACDSSPPPPDSAQSQPDAKAQAVAQACADAKAVLVPDLGEYSRSIHSSSPAAQRYFDQGLRLTYSYYFPEALASFDAALCFDPDNAMIQWGRALAIAPNPNSRYGSVKDDPAGAGWEAITIAQTLAASSTTVSDSDKELIASLMVLFDTETHPDQVARSAAFINATQTLYQQFPQDLEVAFLAADAIMMASPWQYFSTQDGSPMNMADKAQTILETGIAQNPLHPGLNHLHIHLMENSFTPEQAEESADRLESLTPKAGHMVHMPGHIYMRVGRFADAISTNQRSLEADQYFAGVWGELPFPSGTTYGLSHRGHAPHAQNFIHWGAVLAGNSEMAFNTIKPMAEGISAQRLQSGGAQRTLANYWMTMRFFKRWDDILAISLPENAPVYIQGMYHFVRGSAFAAKNSVDSAQTELNALHTVAQQPGLENQRASVNKVSDLLTIAVNELSGDVAKANNQIEGAITFYQQAVDTQDALRYMEPPDWLQSTRLALGNAYLDNEQYGEAEAVFRKDLELLHENGWALYGLLQSLQAQQQEEEIQTTEERFGKAWQYADVDMGSL